MTDDVDTDVPGQREFTDGDGLEVVDSDAACTDCAHFGVCAVRNRFEAVLLEAVNEEPPMHPDELAKICDAYAPDGE